MELTKQVIDKAFELFTRYGIRSVSMDDLARALGISKKTLYQVVDNKADLVERLAMTHYACESKDIIEIQEGEGDAMEKLLAIARYSIEQFSEVSPTMIYDMQKYYASTWVKMDHLYNGFFYEVIFKNLEEGRLQGLFREDFDCDIVARLFVLKTSHMAEGEIFPPNEYGLDKLVEENFRYHAYGVASEAGRKRMEELLAQLQKEKTTKDQ